LVNPNYAIVETGGKQYKVSSGQTINVERLPAEEGSEVELDKVLLVADGEKVVVGTPVVPGAKVVAQSLGEIKGDKVTVFKYKNKTRYRRKTGHRQRYTKLQIKNIVTAKK
jgi:large subunit ribosomal protein L21